MQDLPICFKCGAPSGLLNDYFIKGCNCERSSQVNSKGFNNNELLRTMSSDDNQPIDIVYNTLREIVSLECSDTNGTLNSFAQYPFARAIKILAQRDDVDIISENGPIVKAKWK